MLQESFAHVAVMNKDNRMAPARLWTRRGDEGGAREREDEVQEQRAKRQQGMGSSN
jgi:hypothetical protein